MRHAWIVLPFVLLVTAPDAGRAETTRSTEATWLAWGIGGPLYTADRGPDVAGWFSIHHRRNHTIGSVRLHAIDELQLFCLGPCDPGEGVMDLAVLAGLAARSRFWTVSFEAGPALVMGRLEEDLDRWRSFTTAGLATEAQVVFTPLAHVGLGVHVSGDLNRDNSFVTLTVAFEVGRFR